MITQYEKEAVVDLAQDFAENFWASNKKLSPVILKMLMRTLEKTSRNVQFHSVSEKELTNPAKVISLYSDVFRIMADISTEEESISSIYYKTGELARYFGVSQTTINNWIKEDRFSKVQREGKNRHAKIPEDSVWTANNGRTRTVKEIVDDYKSRHKELNDAEEKQELLQELKYFDNKYSSFEELKAKTSKTAQEEEDLEEWAYYLHRLESE